MKKINFLDSNSIKSKSKYEKYYEYGDALEPYIEDIKIKINESNDGEAIISIKDMTDLMNMSDKDNYTIYSGVKYIMWYNKIAVSPGKYKGELCGILIFKNLINGEKLSDSLVRSGSDFTKYNNECVIKNGYKNYNEYQNECAIKNGYKNYNEYQNEWRHENGKCMPFDENKECPQYLGVYIAERILPFIFEKVKRMPQGNSGYDFICDKGLKIDVKGSCLGSNNTWSFGINKNKIADYFFMVAFDNRDNLNVLGMWLIKCDEVIREKKLNDLTGLVITNNEKRLKRFKKYEITDKIDEVQKACSDFKKLNND